MKAFPGHWKASGQIGAFFFLSFFCCRPFVYPGESWFSYIFRKNTSIQIQPVTPLFTLSYFLPYFLTLFFYLMFYLMFYLINSQSLFCCTWNVPCRGACMCVKRANRLKSLDFQILSSRWRISRFWISDSASACRNHPGYKFWDHLLFGIKCISDFLPGCLPVARFWSDFGFHQFFLVFS